MGERESLTEYRCPDGRHVYEPPLPEVMPGLPMWARVRRRRWVWSLFFGVVGTVFVPWVLIASAGGGSAMLWVFRIAAFLMWPVALLLLVHAWHAVFRPRHITFDAERVWTRDWSLDWVDVEAVYLSPDNWRDEDMANVLPHKQTVIFEISLDDHAYKIGAGNRWDSGVPFRLGGLAPINGLVVAQYDTDPPIRDVYLVMKVLQREAREAAGLPTLNTRPFAPGMTGPLPEDECQA